MMHGYGGAPAIANSAHLIRCDAPTEVKPFELFKVRPALLFGRGMPPRAM